MSQEEGVYGFVPLPREFVPGSRVPPVVIEATVSEAKWDGLNWSAFVKEGKREVSAYYESSANPLQIHSRSRI